ncbi:MAG: hypothetical protein JSS83_00330 [Cyanobacteria bacterium SZAS LIN-3]|nr:hypothetical protein [Cyanobacteria bacterium SZAS LIN-3]
MLQKMETVGTGACAQPIIYDRYTLPTLTILAENSVKEEVQFLAELLKVGRAAELNSHLSDETVLVDKNFVPRMMARLQELQ